MRLPCFIPAVLQLAGAPIDVLTVATLGFNKKNTDDLAALVDAGQVRSVSILCSHYFAAAEAHIYEHAAGFCRRHGFPIVAMRTHAKVLLLAAGEHRLTIESSANLRSCINVEQATVFAAPEVYDFHRGWMLDLIRQAPQEQHE